MAGEPENQNQFAGLPGRALEARLGTISRVACPSRNFEHPQPFPESWPAVDQPGTLRASHSRVPDRARVCAAKHLCGDSAGNCYTSAALDRRRLLEYAQIQ